MSKQPSGNVVVRCKTVRNGMFLFVVYGWLFLSFIVIRNPCGIPLSVLKTFLGVVLSTAWYAVLAYLGCMFARQKYMAITIVIMLSVGVGFVGSLHMFFSNMGKYPMELVLGILIACLLWFWCFINSITAYRAFRREQKAR